MRAHRNLRSTPTNAILPWSYYEGRSGERVQGAEGLTLRGVEPKHPGDTAAAVNCRAGGHRAVFAWLTADSFTVGTPQLPEGARRIRLDPHVHRTFMVAGEPMGRRAVCFLMPDGTAWTSDAQVDA